MARNRQRARDRKKLHRENIPGSLDNVSGEVDAAEASIVAGAAGIPDDTGALERDPAVEEERLGGGAGDVAGAFLGLADVVAQRLVDLIL